MTAKTTPDSPAAVPQAAHKTVKQGFLERLLDPIDGLVEGIYSVLIVLTFTLATRAIFSYSDTFDQAEGQLAMGLLVAAAGCAIAWGLIDGIMYVLICAFERGKDRRLYRLVRAVASEDEGITLLADELDDDLAALTDEAERRKLYGALLQRLRTAPPPMVGIERGDVAGGLGTFLVAVAAAIPVLLPLLLPIDLDYRVRASNFVAFAMLFLMGFRWGQYSGGKPILTGVLLLIVGIVMMMVAIPLGG